MGVSWRIDVQPVDVLDRHATVEDSWSGVITRYHRGFEILQAYRVTRCRGKYTRALGWVTEHGPSSLHPYVPECDSGWWAWDASGFLHRTRFDSQQGGVDHIARPVNYLTRREAHHGQ